MKKIILLCLSITFGFISDQNLSVEAYNKLSEAEKRDPSHAIDGLDLLDPELEITLFASEPMMSNPTNMDIDDKGRIWICEAYNYRNALNPRNPYNKKGDRILILEDTDHDGKADKSTVFYQGEDINAALGIAVLGNKVYVSCSPNVLVFTDENQDDVPDSKEVMFTGIGGIQHDHGMHAFVFGPDGKLYFNYGNEGKGLLTRNKEPIKDELGNIIKGDGKPYREGMVYRSELDGSNVEILAWNFRNNYELTLDSYGTMWQSDNDDDGNRSTRINYVMPHGNYGYKDEMTGADWRVRRTNLEDSVYQQHWHLNDPGVVPNLLQTYAGSPTGIVLYEGDLLPQKYRNQIIHCDAGPNIVRAYPAQKSGAGYKAKILPILDGSKKDKWFRPSDVTVAPDGSIYISDWYDPGVGGHAMGDSLRGRVFRIAPKNHRPTVPKFIYSDPSEAIVALQNPNQAVRFKAFMALKSLGKAAENNLKELAKNQNTRMAARAYWLLAQIDNKYITEASNSKNEDVRIQAIRMASELLKNPHAFYLKMSNDASIQVKREIAVEIRHKKYSDVWLKLAEAYDGGDRWYLEALGIGADLDWDNCLKLLKENNESNWLKTDKTKDLVWRSRGLKTKVLLAEIIKNSPESQKGKYYRAFDFQDNTDKNDILLGLIKNAKSTEEKVTIFKHFDQATIHGNPTFNKELPLLMAGIKSELDFLEIVDKYSIKSQFSRLHKLAMTNSNTNISTSAATICVKNHGTLGLETELKNKTNAKKAIDVYGEVDKANVTAILIKTFTNKKLSHSLREQAIEEMIGWESEETLWKLTQAGKIPKEFLPIVENILKQTWHSDIRVAASKYFVNGEEEQKINTTNVLSQSGNLSSGKQLFETYCTTCHVANNKGTDFGPGLSQIGKKLSKEGLLNAIINPSEGISFGYEGQNITLFDGSMYQGILTSKTENDFMIKYPGQSKVNIVKRKDVKQILAMEESIMPKFPLKEQELADLVGYLETLK